MKVWGLLKGVTPQSGLLREMNRHGPSAYIRIVRTQGMRLQGVNRYILRYPQTPADPSLHASSGRSSTVSSRRRQWVGTTIQWHREVYVKKYAR